MKEHAPFIVWDEEARDQLVRKLMAMPIDPLRPVMVTVDQYEESTTDDQRGYYQSVVLPTLCAHTGYRKHEMHEILRTMHGPKAAYEVGGRRVVTSTFTTSNRGPKRVTAAFLDIVIAWARDDLGVVIPPPVPKEERQVRQTRAAA